MNQPCAFCAHSKAWHTGAPVTSELYRLAASLNFLPCPEETCDLECHCPGFMPDLFYDRAQK